MREALPELLTLHKLKITGELNMNLHTSNGIENLFSSVRHREHNIKNYNPSYRGKIRKKKLSQKWLAVVFIKAEENFRTIKGYKDIATSIKRIEKIQTEIVDIKRKLSG